jgi:hypothetical protein
MCAPGGDAGWGAVKTGIRGVEIPALIELTAGEQAEVRIKSKKLKRGNNFIMAVLCNFIPTINHCGKFTPFCRRVLFFLKTTLLEGDKPVWGSVCFWGKVGIVGESMDKI